MPVPFHADDSGTGDHGSRGGFGDGADGVIVSYDNYDGNDFSSNRKPDTPSKCSTVLLVTTPCLLMSLSYGLLLLVHIVKGLSTAQRRRR